MKEITNNEMAQVYGGDDGALTVFGAQLASDGLNYAGSSNPAVASLGLFVAAAGGWAWAFGSACDGILSLF